MSLPREYVCVFPNVVQNEIQVTVRVANINWVAASGMTIQLMFTGTALGVAKAKLG